MTQNSGRRSRLPVVLILLLLAGLILGVSLVDTQIGLILLISAVAAWVIQRVGSAILRGIRRRRESRQAAGKSRGASIWLLIGGILLAGLCLVGGLAAVGFFLILPAGGAAYPETMAGEQSAIPCPDVIVEGVQLNVTTENLQEGTGVVGGVVRAYPPGLEDGFWDTCPREQRGESFIIDLPQMNITAEKRGLLLKEFVFNEDALVENALIQSGYDRISERYSVMTVELQDFPKNSFFEARDISDLEQSAYLNTETVRWTQQADDPVMFSYIPPTWRFTRPLLGISYRVGSLGEAVVGFGGFVGTFVLASIFEAVIGDFGKERLSKLSGRRKK